MLEGDVEKRECEGETPKIGQRWRQLTPSLAAPDPHVLHMLCGGAICNRRVQQRDVETR